MQPVLIVDDDDDIRRLVGILLATSGYETMTARNGLQALDQMREQLPCLVLLDMKMPGMDGTEFRRRQLADPLLRHVPVVCLTGHYDSELFVGNARKTSWSRPFPTPRSSIRAMPS